MEIRDYWNSFIEKNPTFKDCSYNSWAFGVDADALALLVVNGIKTATASLFDLYELEKEALPQEGQISIILDAEETKPICIIQTTKVTVSPFKMADEKHAFKEGEGDRSLSFWRKVHKDFFSECLENTALAFTDDSLVVLEEFQVIYPSDNF